MDIIEYINKVNKEWHPDLMEMNDISEMFMHKILFIIYGEFYARYEIELWKPKFVAGKYGPIELNNYQRYLYDGIDEYHKLNDAIDVLKLNYNQIQWLRNEIIRIIKHSIFTVIEYICNNFECWKTHYDNNEEEIPNDEIRKEFIKILNK